MNNQTIETVIETKVETPTILPTVDPNVCVLCGAESEFGVVGIKGDEIYHNNFCSNCYYETKRNNG